MQDLFYAVQAAAPQSVGGVFSRWLVAMVINPCSELRLVLMDPMGEVLSTRARMHTTYVVRGGKDPY